MAWSLKGSATCIPPGILRALRGHSMPNGDSKMFGHKGQQKINKHQYDQIRSVLIGLKFTKTSVENSLHKHLQPFQIRFDSIVVLRVR